MSKAEPPGDFLVQLLKHALLELGQLNLAAVAPFGIDGRELAVLMVLANADVPSQQDAARQLGVDRTTMVAMIDSLAAKHLVARRQDPHDRRRNVVELTAAGSTTLDRATQASIEAERQYLKELTPTEAKRLKDSLRKIIQHTPQ